MDDINKNLNNWNFFSNNAHVLVCLSHKPQPTMREIAVIVGITERAVQRILAKLVRTGVVHIRKEGRRNRYELDFDRKLGHPLEAHKSIGEFLGMIKKQNQNSD